MDRAELKDIQRQTGALRARLDLVETELKRAETERDMMGQALMAATLLLLAQEEASDLPETSP